MDPFNQSSALMGAHPPAGLDRALTASILALTLLLALWELWLAPARPGGSWLVLKALPLALALPGLLRGSRYTRQWLSLLLPFYFAEGIVRAFSETGRVRLFSAVEIVLAFAAFVLILWMLRKRGKPALASSSDVGAVSERGSNSAPAPGSAPRSSRRSSDDGFTMLELMSGVAIFAVLSFVAYPSYLAYKVRANRAAAQALLIDLANRQQLYVLDARNYAATLADLGLPQVPSDVGTYYAVPDPVVDNAAMPPMFVVSAVARAGTIQARDGDLSVNSMGVRSGHW